MSQDIFVVVEQLRGEVADVTFELLGLGRELAGATGGSLQAVLLGSDLTEVTGSLGVADGVIRTDDPALTDFNPEPYLACLQEIISHRSPRLVLIPNTSMGMDLAAALSVRLDLPLVAYAKNVTADAQDLVATSQLYGGKIFAESLLHGDSSIVSVLAGSFQAEAGCKQGAPEVEDVALPEDAADPKLRFCELIEPEAGDVDITQHELLVSVGRGIQSQDNLAQMEELARVLGGAVSASRPIIDQKWLPKSRQVGKSGLKVKPRIYLALGISGAPEHLEGMKDAELIIAVNTDETAPIFEVAHYGSTEDLFDIVPALIEKLR